MNKPIECEDAISRKAILEEFENDQYHLEFCKEHHIERSISMEMVRIRLHDLPSVNPQPCKDTRMIDKSNFNMEQYKTDIQSAYDCGKASVAPCEDAISRQEAVEAFQMFREYESNRSNKGWVNRIETVLNQLPPVTPQAKTGHWIDFKEWYECSECGESHSYCHKYCPYCGAKMEVSNATD